MPKYFAGYEGGSKNLIILIHRLGQTNSPYNYSQLSNETLLLI